MIDLAITIDVSGAKDRVGRLPDAVRAAVNEALDRGARELARAARDKAPDDLYGALRNSIKATQVGDMHFRVAPGVSYARKVEEGTRPGYWPNVGALQDYIRRKLTRGGMTLRRQGSLGRYEQEADIARRAILMMRSIHAKGTKPHPFMRPAMVETEPRIRALVKGAIARAVAGGGA